MDEQKQKIVSEMMERVSDDVADAINHCITEVPPNMILPVTNRAVRTAIASSAMIYDIASGLTDAERMPTRQSMVLATLVTLHNLLDTDDVWSAAIADLKKHFPDAKIPEINVVDRRQRKRAH